jgi:hypothetical protein
MYFEIIKAEYLKDYQIALAFKDGKAGIVDLTEYLGNNDVFAQFHNESFFRTFRIEYGTLVWGDGLVDIAPETLYQKTTISSN